MSETLFALLITLLDNIFIDFEQKIKKDYVYLSSVPSLKKQAYMAITETNDTDPIDPLDLKAIFRGAKSFLQETYAGCDAKKLDQLNCELDDLYTYLYDAVLTISSFVYTGDARERDMDQDRSRYKNNSDWER